RFRAAAPGPPVLVATGVAGAGPASLSPGRSRKMAATSAINAPTPPPTYSGKRDFAVGLSGSDGRDAAGGVQLGANTVAADGGAVGVLARSSAASTSSMLRKRLAGSA